MSREVFYGSWGVTCPPGNQLEEELESWKTLRAAESEAKEALKAALQRVLEAAESRLKLAYKASGNCASYATYEAEKLLNSVKQQGLYLPAQPDQLKKLVLLKQDQHLPAAWKAAAEARREYVATHPVVSSYLAAD